MNHINKIFLKLGFKLGFPPEFRVMVYIRVSNASGFYLRAIAKPLRASKFNCAQFRAIAFYFLAFVFQFFENF